MVFLVVGQHVIEAVEDPFSIIRLILREIEFSHGEQIFGVSPIHHTAQYLFCFVEVVSCDGFPEKEDVWQRGVRKSLARFINEHHCLCLLAYEVEVVSKIYQLLHVEERMSVAFSLFISEIEELKLLAVEKLVACFLHLFCFAQVSFSPTVLLNTKCSGVVSASGVKYPMR